jgi:hypothetical protein
MLSLVGRVAVVFGAGALALACSGKSVLSGEPSRGQGGSLGGEGGRKGQGGSAAGSSGNPAHAGSSDGGMPGHAGSGGVASTLAGAGGVAGALGGAGGALAGAGGAAGASNTPQNYALPAPGQAWQFESGDPLNSTPPVLIAVDTGVVIAGASSDPATVGLSAFDAGIESEAFVARLDQNGKAIWALPLKAAGLPWAIARSGDDVLLVAPNLPDLAQVSTSYVSKELYLAKIGIDGTPRFQKTLSFTHEDTFTYALTVDASGAIFLAGAYQDPSTSAGEHPILIKCDDSGTVLWQKTFTHAGTQGVANAITVLSGGDLVVTGAFDATLSLGGSTHLLTSAAGGIPSGFLARFSSDGTPVWSQSFGGSDFSIGSALTALPGGDFALAGSSAATLTLAGKTAQAAPFTPSAQEPFPPTAAFVARVSDAGQASWLKLETETQFARVLASDGGSTIFLGGSMDVPMPASGSIYLRTYDARSGNALQVLRATSASDMTSTALAVASHSVWVSGMFSSSTNLGNGNLLTNSNSGVFLSQLAAE